MNAKFDLKNHDAGITARLGRSYDKTDGSFTALFDSKMNYYDWLLGGNVSGNMGTDGNQFVVTLDKAVVDFFGEKLKFDFTGDFIVRPLQNNVEPPTEGILDLEQMSDSELSSLWEEIIDNISGGFYSSAVTEVPVEVPAEAPAPPAED